MALNSNSDTTSQEQSQVIYCLISACVVGSFFLKLVIPIYKMNLYTHASLLSKLEILNIFLCLCATTAIPQVRIALQMEDGSRLQDSFSCGQSLWELLTHFPQTRCVCAL